MFEMPLKLSESDIQQLREELTDMLIEETIRGNTMDYIKRYMSDPENVKGTHIRFERMFDLYLGGYFEDIMVKLYFRYEALAAALNPIAFELDNEGKPQFKNEDDMWQLQDRFNYWFEHWYTRKHPEMYPVKFPRGRVEAIAEKVGYQVVHTDKTEQLAMF
jgi:hypothetical protein